jgi:hypothetical protein
VNRDFRFDCIKVGIAGHNFRAVPLGHCNAKGVGICDGVARFDSGSFEYQSPIYWNDM